MHAITGDLGSRWEVLRVGFKPYSANGSCHPTIDLLKGLRDAETFNLGDVEAVDIRVSSATAAHVGREYRPHSVTTAQMNLPYICAVVLRDGDAFVDQFNAEPIRDPELVAFSRRVTVRADPDIDAAGEASRHTTHLTIRLRDGRALSGQAQRARGSEQFPLGPEEIRAKYRTLAAKALPAERVAHLEDLVDGAALLSDLRPLIGALLATSKDAAPR